jgi:RecB family endonuclease NucS
MKISEKNYLALQTAIETVIEIIEETLEYLESEIKQTYIKIIPSKVYGV